MSLSRIELCLNKDDVKARAITVIIVSKVQSNDYLYYLFFVMSTKCSNKSRQYEIMARFFQNRLQSVITLVRKIFLVG